MWLSLTVIESMWLSLTDPPACMRWMKDHGCIHPEAEVRAHSHVVRGAFSDGLRRWVSNVTGGPVPPPDR